VFHLVHTTKSTSGARDSLLSHSARITTSRRAGQEQQRSADDSATHVSLLVSTCTVGSPSCVVMSKFLRHTPQKRTNPSHGIQRQCCVLLDSLPLSPFDRDTIFQKTVDTSTRGYVIPAPIVLFPLISCRASCVAERPSRDLPMQYLTQVSAPTPKLPPAFSYMIKPTSGLLFRSRLNAPYWQHLNASIGIAVVSSTCTRWPCYLF